LIICLPILKLLSLVFKLTHKLLQFCLLILNLWCIHDTLFVFAFSALLRRYLLGMRLKLIVFINFNGQSFFRKNSFERVTLSISLSELFKEHNRALSIFTARSGKSYGAGVQLQSIWIHWVCGTDRILDLHSSLTMEFIILPNYKS